MLKNLLASILTSLGLLFAFYILDNSSSNGGNYIFFSFLFLAAAYVFPCLALLLVILYLSIKYFNGFLTVFLPTFILINLLTGYFLFFKFSESGTKEFINNSYFILGFLGIILMVGLSLLHHRLTKKSSL